MGIRQPGVKRKHRHFNGKAEKQPEEDEILRRKSGKYRLGRDIKVVDQRENVKSEFARAVLWVVVEEVQTQDCKQHEHRAEQRIQEKLNGRVELAPVSPNANEEVHRHQHDFPENVEEKEIEC